MGEPQMVSQLTRLLTDWLPTYASLAVSDQEKYIHYKPGAYDLKIETGYPIPLGSVSAQVIENKRRIEAGVNSSVFGLPYYGLGYPLQTEKGFFGALTVILPPELRSITKPIAYVVGQAGEIWRPIQVEKICYFESAQKKTWMFTADQVYVVPFTLTEVERRLPNNQFIRIHRSYIVNIGYIDQISRDINSYMWMRLIQPLSTKLPVSQSYVKAVRHNLGF